MAIANANLLNMLSAHYLTAPGKKGIPQSGNLILGVWQGDAH